MPEVKSDIKQLSGPEKASILMLCLGEELGSELLKQLDEPEIHSISSSISGLGTVSSNAVEDVLTEFEEAMSNGSALIGNFSAAEAFLSNVLPADKVAELMREVRGPIKGKNLWERFSSLNETIIAGYIKGESPQTIAAILFRTKPEKTSKVLPLLEKNLMHEVIERMIKIEAVASHGLDSLENIIEREILSSAARSTTSDPLQKAADIFNKIDPEIFQDISSVLEGSMPEQFDRIKQKMFTFDDLERLDTQSIGKIIREPAAKDVLPVALKGAKKDIREHFLSAMAERTRDMLIDDIDTMGPIRKRDAQDAQSIIVDVAKNLADEGAIQLPLNEDDELIS